MEENLHKDNLEEFFKNSFENENIEPSDNQWDVPSDAVWSGINDSINPGGASTGASIFNFKWIMATAAGILFLGLVYYSYTLNIKVNELQEQVESQENTIFELKDEILTANEKNERIEEEFDRVKNEVKSNSVVNGGKEEGGWNEGGKEEGVWSEGGRSDGGKEEGGGSDGMKNAEFSNTPFEGSNSKTNKEQLKQNDPQYGLNQKELPKQEISGKDKSINDPQPNSAPNKKSTKSKEIVDENSIIEVSSNIIANDDSKALDSQPEIPASEKLDQKLTNQSSSESLKSSIALLMPLPSKLVYAQTNGYPEEITLDLLPVPENAFDKPSLPQFKPGFYLGAHIAPTYTYRNIRSVNGPVLRRLLNQKEQAVYSLALGLKVGYQFSKNWSVETGLNYYKNSVQSLHKAQIRYESQIERLNTDGNYDSNYHLNLSTSYGEIETDVALTRSSNTSIDQNDYINLVLKTRQELKYLGVPIALRYRTAGNKFHFSAKAGISGNFILQKDVTIKAAQVNRSGVHHRRTIVDRKFSGLKNTTFDFLFGIGADYDISKNMSVYFEPTITHSLSPAYRLDGKIKTYPIVASLNIGLSYRF